VGIYRELVEVGESGASGSMRRAEDRLGEPEDATDVWRSIRCELGRVVRPIARGDTAFVAAVNGPEEFAEPHRFTTGPLQDVVHGMLESRA
jgi:hypothetical protein